MANRTEAEIQSDFGDIIRASLATTFDDNLLPGVSTDETESTPVFEKTKFTSPDQISTYLKANRNNFTLLSLNLNSMEQKMDQLLIFLGELQNENLYFSCLCFQEARLTEEKLDRYRIHGYKKFPQKAIVSQNGGLLIYVKDDFKGTVRKNLYKKSEVYEALFVEISGPLIKDKKITIGNLYRPPRDSKRLLTVQNFCDELKPMVRKLQNENSYSVLCGDFNLNLLDIHGDNGFNFYFNFMTERDFVPVITLPARFEQNTCSLIDHIWVNKPVNGALDPANSSSRVLLKKIAKADHLPCVMSLNILDHQKPPVPKFFYSQKIDDESIAAFRSDLIDSNLIGSIDQSTDGNPEETYNKIDETLSSLRDKHFPKRKIRFKRHVHKINPWMTDILLLNIKLKDAIYVKFRKCSNIVEKFKLKRKLKSMEKDLADWISEAKAKYYGNLFHEYQNDVKKTWDTIKTAINKRRHKSKYPDFFKVNNTNIFDKTEISNKFNRYFVDIGPELADSLDTSGKPTFTSYLGPPTEHRFSFRLIRQAEIEKLIDNLPAKKSAGPDGLSSIIIKKIRNELAPILTIAINQSLSSGIFPSNLKVAKVIPIFKNKGEPTEFGNYRPISLLNVISKFFERVIYNQIYAYFTNNNLFFNSQYGFRTKHSTEDAAIELIDQVHKVFENNPEDHVVSVFLDLSKAFDTIDHEIMLKKLAHYGITGAALQWFRSYLSDRKQFILYDDLESDLLNITVGVPQGSILGPLLFLIYINDASRATQALKFVHFADDTTLFQNIAFFSGSESSLTQSQVERRINVELKSVYDWLCVNKLSLNVSKTRCIVFKNPKYPTVCKPYEFEINNEKIKCVSEFNFLGIMLDEFLSWTPHTKKVTSKISRTLGVIKRVRKFLPFHALEKIYNALVVPHLNYGLKLWGTNLAAVSKIQKRAIRIITCSKFLAHTSPLFKHNHILKVEDMYKLQCLKLYYKIQKGTVPQYISTLTIHNRDIHGHNTRGRDDIRPTDVKSKWLRHSLPDLILNTPRYILSKIYEASINTFALHVTLHYLEQYEVACTREVCLVCGRSAID